MGTMMPLLLKIPKEKHDYEKLKVAHNNSIYCMENISLITGENSAWPQHNLSVSKRLLPTNIKPRVFRGQLYCTVINFPLQQSHEITKETQVKKNKEHRPLPNHNALAALLAEHKKFSPLFGVATQKLVFHHFNTNVSTKHAFI